MFGQKTVLYLEKILIVIIILAGLVFANNFFYNWTGSLKDYFFMSGHWEELAIITVFAFGIGYIVNWLAKSGLRLESSRPRRR